MFRRFSTAKVRTSKHGRYRMSTLLAVSALFGMGYCNWVLYFADSGKQQVSHQLRKKERSRIIRVVPSRLLSRFWGRFSNSNFSSHFISAYATIFSCDLGECDPSEAAKFDTLAQFFRRNLKPESRPICIDQPMVSPCDGKVLNFGTISSEALIDQIKGHSYSVRSLLDCEIPQSPHRERQLHYITLYLSPRDYHHFHSPADWRLKRATHIPGDLLPVSPWLLKWVPDIFCKNERVVLTGDWKWGFFSLVAVGAYNVGNIHIARVPGIRTNLEKPPRTRVYPVDSLVRAGEEIGEFELGSTLIMVFHAPKDFAFSVSSGAGVKYGEPIGVLLSERKECA